MKRSLYSGVAAIAVAVFLAAAPARLSAQTVAIDGDDVAQLGEGTDDFRLGVRHGELLSA